MLGNTLSLVFYWTLQSKINFNVVVDEFNILKQNLNSIVQKLRFVLSWLNLTMVNRSFLFILPWLESDLTIVTMS